VAGERPQIECPCEYPIAVVGAAVADFQTLVEAIIERHAPDFPRHLTTVRASGGGRYVSVRVIIIATGEPQLRALFAELKATGLVQAVL
jgi:putative lipoic acid-binding regulatory protein